MRKAEIKMHSNVVGWLTQDDTGYHFFYDPNYLQSVKPKPVSRTLPLQVEAFESKTLFSFFDGLIPEGWLLEVVEKNWKLNPRDRMGLLLACCKDCIGAVSILPLKEQVDET